jgi:hypothetical protein
MAYVLPTAIGAASIAVMLAAGWFIGGAVAGLLGEPSPDVGDRTMGCVFTVMGAALVALSLFAAYGIGAVILDALR